MPIAILTLGVSASGKSTWADDYVRHHPTFAHVNRDTIRQDIWYSCFETPFSWEGWIHWCRSYEKEVTQRFNQILDNIIHHQQNVVISDTHLNTRTRHQLIHQLETNNYRVEIKLFPVSFVKAVERDYQRSCPVGYQVIAQQFIKWNKYVKKQYVPDAKLPKAIVVDIDGTLTQINHSRSPYNWDKVDLDSPNSIIIDLVRRFKDDHSVLILTGREYSAETKTREWLNQHSIPFDHLFMRNTQDRRSGDTVKEELFWTYMAPNFHVIWAIDDTPKIVRMWQSIGVPVLALGNQYIEKPWQTPKL